MPAKLGEEGAQFVRTTVDVADDVEGSGQLQEKKLAVRVGFEPTVPVKVRQFSRLLDSTTLAPHRLPS